VAKEEAAMLTNQETPSRSVDRVLALAAVLTRANPVLTRANPQEVPLRQHGITEPTPDRRRCFRRSCHLAISWHPLNVSGQQALPAHARDISADGIGLEVDQPIESQKTFYIRLQGSARGSTLTKVVRLKHVQPETGARRCAGAAFVKKLTTDELRWLLETPMAAADASAGTSTTVTSLAPSSDYEILELSPKS
jgi:hypothetical protein